MLASAEFSYSWHGRTFRAKTEFPYAPFRDKFWRYNWRFEPGFWNQGGGETGRNVVFNVSPFLVLFYTIWFRKDKCFKITLAPIQNLLAVLCGMRQTVLAESQVIFRSVFLDCTPLWEPGSVPRRNSSDVATDEIPSQISHSTAQEFIRSCSGWGTALLEAWHITYILEMFLPPGSQSSKGFVVF